MNYKILGITLVSLFIQNAFSAEGIVSGGKCCLVSSGKISTSCTALTSPQKDGTVCTQSSPLKSKRLPLPTRPTVMSDQDIVAPCVVIVPSY